MAITPLTIRVPIRGKLLVQLDGTDTPHEVGAFTNEVEVAFQPGPGNIEFRFDEKFWEANVKSKPKGPAPRAAASVVQDVLSTWQEIPSSAEVQLSTEIVEALEKAGFLQ